MDQLKDMLIKKARIIGECKYPQKNTRQSILKYLKKIRKQQKQTQYEETQLIQSISYQKIITKQEIQKAYYIFFSIMKSFCKKFQFIPQQKDLFQNTIELNVSFYQKQQSFSRAQQVKRVYKRKLCQKELLLSTLFRWLHEWGRKKLTNFLKENIQSIEKDLIFDKLDSNTQKKTQIINIKSNLALDGTLKKISNSQRLTLRPNKINIHNASYIKDIEYPIQNNVFAQQNQNTNSNIKTEIFSKFQIQQNQKNIQKSLINLIKDDTLKEFNHNETNNNSCIIGTNNSVKRTQHIQNCRQKTIISLSINKQIFFGAYWQQMNSYYRNLNCIQDLDMYYLKTFRKQNSDRKIQILKQKIQDITESIIKTMPHIKKSIENYDYQYLNNCPQNIKIKKNNKYQHKISQQTQRQKFWDNLLCKTKNKIISYRTRVNIRSQNSNYNANNQQKEVYYTQKITTQNQHKRVDFTAGKLINRDQSSYERSDKQLQTKNIKKQIKLPIVYNPENICIESQITASNPSIHQTNQKNYSNYGKFINKGIVRYKFLNRQSDKAYSPHEAYEKLNFSSQILQQKNKQYEVPNIRKILRKRQRQKNVHAFNKFNKNQFNQIQDQKSFHSDINVNPYGRDNGDKYMIFLKNSFSPNPFDQQIDKKSRIFQSLKKILPQKKTSFYNNTRPNPYKIPGS